MIEFIKAQALNISIFFNALSILIVVGLITYFVVMGKGIIINNTSNAISNSTSNSYANSGSLSIGYIGGDYRGNWVIIKKEFELEEGVYSFIKTLDPIQFLNCKIVYVRLIGYSVYYPESITAENKDTKTKKVVNGKEIK